MGGNAPLVQAVGKNFRHVFIPVDHKDLLWGGGEVGGPGQQMVPVRVGAEALEVLQMGLDGDLLAEELHALRALQQGAAQGSLPLVAHENHGALRPPEVVF